MWAGRRSPRGKGRGCGKAPRIGPSRRPRTRVRLGVQEPGQAAALLLCRTRATKCCVLREVVVVCVEGRSPRLQHAEGCLLGDWEGSGSSSCRLPLPETPDTRQAGKESHLGGAGRGSPGGGSRKEAPGRLDTRARFLPPALTHLLTLGGGETVARYFWLSPLRWGTAPFTPSAVSGGAPVGAEVSGGIFAAWPGTVSEGFLHGMV